MNILGTAKTKLKIQAQPINTLASRPGKENRFYRRATSWPSYPVVRPSPKRPRRLSTTHSYWKSSWGAWWRRICRRSARPARKWTNTWRPPETHTHAHVYTHTWYSRTRCDGIGRETNKVCTPSGRFGSRKRRLVIQNVFATGNDNTYRDVSRDEHELHYGRDR